MVTMLVAAPAVAEFSRMVGERVDDALLREGAAAPSRACG
jgi:hypothetical protein